MTDLPLVLPHFDLKPYSHLLHSLDKNQFMVSDLITCDPVDIAKQCPLPLGEVRKLVAAVDRALQQDVRTSVGMQANTPSAISRQKFINIVSTTRPHKDGRNGALLVKALDRVLDEALGGGIPAGYLTEIAGER